VIFREIGNFSAPDGVDFFDCSVLAVLMKSVSTSVLLGLFGVPRNPDERDA
jgi:hypothetical protein